MSSGLAHEPVSVTLGIFVSHIADFGRMYWKELLALCMLLLPLATYSSLVVGNWLRINSKKDGRLPPVIPYWFPFVGSLFAVGMNPFKFLSSVKDVYGPTVPVGVKMGPLQTYLISSASAFMNLTKSSQHLKPKPAIAVAMENVFGTPSRAIHVYKEDVSGIAPTPMQGTKVEPKRRIWYHHSKAAHTYLSGKSLQVLGTRFMENLSHRISTDESIGTTWVERPDLYVFWQDQVFAAAVDALFGPHLLLLNPTFTRDFWAYVGCMSTLMMGLPKWMTPKSWRTREKVLEGIKTWHQHALTHADPFKEGERKEWDEYWGSTYLKARYRFVSAIPSMDEDAHAADDLALMVAASANAIISSVWFLLETILRPTLFPRLQRELEIARLPSVRREARFDVGTLCAQPLMQSIYAETLRLRMGLLINRTSQRKEVRMGSWRFPPNAPIAISTTTAATNAEIWNDAGGKHPLDRFWADRFLIFPDDPESGPLRRPLRAPNAEKLPAASSGAANAPKFSLDGLAGGWIPYGAGEFMCPGRHLAKQEMIGSFAMFLASYEVQLKKPEGWKPEPDMSFFATGTMPPLGSIPFRIRKRQ